MKTIEKIVEMPQPLGIYAGELLQRADEFLTAFERLRSQEEPDLPFATYFLLAHSLELFLKSFLVAHGTTKQQLRGNAYGHHLHNLLDHCEKAGLSGGRDLRIFVLTMNEMNSFHDFRYPSGYNLHLPKPSVCSQIMRELKSSIEPKVDASAFSDLTRFRSETNYLRGKAKIRWSD